MADFAPDVTPRYRVRYLSAGIPHHWLFRVPRGTSQVDTIGHGATAAHALADALKNNLPVDWAWLSAEYIPQDTNIAQSAATPTAVTGTQALNVYTPQDKASHITFSGKSIAATGSKTSVKVFGWAALPDVVGNLATKFVYNPGDVALVDAAVTALNAQNNLCAIDGGQISWHGRVTLKLNDFYLRRVRSGLIT